MPYVTQAKGLQHCKNLKQEAWKMWRTISHSRRFDQCLKDVIEDHRRLVEDEIKMKIKQETEDHECL